MTELETIDDWDELVRVVTDEPNLLVRCSEGPDVDRNAGVSRDYEAGIDLPGLSVTTIGPETWWSRPAEDWIARRLCKYADLGEEEERFPWLLTGTQVGVGPDHEPLSAIGNRWRASASTSSKRPRGAITTGSTSAKTPAIHSLRQAVGSFGEWLQLAFQ